MCHLRRGRGIAGKAWSQRRVSVFDLLERGDPLGDRRMRVEEVVIPTLVVLDTAQLVPDHSFERSRRASNPVVAITAAWIGGQSARSSRNSSFVAMRYRGPEQRRRVSNRARYREVLPAALFAPYTRRPVGGNGDVGVTRPARQPFGLAVSGSSVGTAPATCRSRARVHRTGESPGAAGSPAVPGRFGIRHSTSVLSTEVRDVDRRRRPTTALRTPVAITIAQRQGVHP